MSLHKKFTQNVLN